MRYFLLFFIYTSFSTTIFCQDLVDIELNETSFKFPKVVYKKSSTVEEKINYYLHLKYLKHLPGKFKENPFEIITNPKKVAIPLTFNSFKNRALNNNILCVQLNGIRKDKPFEFLEHFDIRTGDFFSIFDLFNEEGTKKIHQSISDKIEDLANKGEVASSKYNPSLSYKLLNDKLVLVFLKLKQTIELNYTDLKPYMSDYGKNILFSSKEIIRRSDMNNKLLKGEGITNKGTKYERKLNYSILILGINKDNKATLYKWKDSLKDAQKYYESEVTENQIKGENIIWDERQQRKVNMYHSILLNKNSDGNWEGKLQLGSPSYPMIFKEY